MANPSDFITYPWDSVFRNSECETVALNIMKILSRTGNMWRTLSWEEYLDERVKDGGGNTYSTFAGYESDFFKKVLEYTTSENAARKFSNQWKTIKMPYDTLRFR